MNHPRIYDWVKNGKLTDALVTKTYFCRTSNISELIEDEEFCISVYGCQKDLIEVAAYDNKLHGDGFSFNPEEAIEAPRDPENEGLYGLRARILPVR